MKYSISIIVGFFLCVAIATAQTAPVPAQAAGTSGPPVELKLFGMEAGVVLGYDLGAGALAGGTSFALDFVVADNLVVGFRSTKITPAAGALVSYDMLRLSWYLNRLLGFSISTGTNGTSPAAALGVFLIPARGASANGLATAYKVRMEYLFPTDDIAAGSIAVAACVGLGI